MMKLLLPGSVLLEPKRSPSRSVNQKALWHPNRERLRIPKVQASTEDLLAFWLLYDINSLRLD
jgi:hypothetical protein